MRTLVGLGLTVAAGALLWRWYGHETLREGEGTVRLQSEHEHFHFHVDLPSGWEIQPGDTVEILSMPNVNGHTQGEQGGTSAVTLTVSQLPAHGHFAQASNNVGDSQTGAGNVLDDEGWKNWLARLRPGFDQQLKRESAELPAGDEQAFARMPQMLKQSKWAIAAVAPRGIGPAKWAGDEKKQTQIRRRFMLLGQTRDGMRVWDVRRAVQALRSLPELKDAPLRLQGHDDLAGVALYASLFEPTVTHLHLVNPPTSHMRGPHFLNVLRFLDMPQALAMAAEKKQVRVYQQGGEGWSFVTETAKALKWPEGRIEFRSGQE